MHTTELDTEDGPVALIHNGDWSGDVEVVFLAKGDRDGVRAPRQPSIKLPGEFLLSLSRAAVREKGEAPMPGKERALRAIAYAILATRDSLGGSSLRGEGYEGYELAATKLLEEP